MAQFDFKIEHRAGKKHGNADALSRVPCDPDECPCYDGRSILTELPCGGCDKCVAKSEQSRFQQSRRRNPPIDQTKSPYINQTKSPYRPCYRRQGRIPSEHSQYCQVFMQ